MDSIKYCNDYKLLSKCCIKSYNLELTRNDTFRWTKSVFLYYSIVVMLTKNDTVINALVNPKKQINKQKKGTRYKFISHFIIPVTSLNVAVYYSIKSIQHFVFSNWEWKKKKNSCDTAQKSKFNRIENEQQQKRFVLCALNNLFEKKNIFYYLAFTQA